MAAAEDRRDRDGDFGSADAMPAVTILPLGVDDLSNVRYIHATSIRLHAAHVLSDEEIRAFTDHVYSDAYATQLARTRLLGATIGGELVGTSGWSYGDDSASGARISSLHVRPLFTRLGIGQALLAAAEAAAGAAGFDSFAARATLNSIGFFERYGYVVTSQGLYPMRPDIGLPVAFMRKSEPPPAPVKRIVAAVTTH
jgi:GNAT superfamily N-acetyltransferase